MHEPEFTERERAVIELVARGLTNHAVSTELGISESRVKRVVQQLCRKLGAQNRTEAAVKYMRRFGGEGPDSAAEG
jgi:DNA-binding NarL/FixJ family response regulator